LYLFVADMRSQTKRLRYATWQLSVSAAGQEWQLLLPAPGPISLMMLFVSYWQTFVRLFSFQTGMLRFAIRSVVGPHLFVLT
jgi:hypothetical protein